MNYNFQYCLQSFSKFIPKFITIRIKNFFSLIDVFKNSKKKLFPVCLNPFFYQIIFSLAQGNGWFAFKKFFDEYKNHIQNLRYAHGPIEIIFPIPARICRLLKNTSYTTVFFFAFLRTLPQVDQVHFRLISDVPAQ